MNASSVTATEFKQNLGRFLALASEQDVEVTKNGQVVAILTHPNRDKSAIIDSLNGLFHGYVDLAADRDERISAL